MALNEYDHLLKEGNSGSRNEYDHLLAKLDNEPKAALQQSMFAARDAVPDRKAEAIKLANKLNVRPEFVEENYDAIKESEYQHSFDYDAIVKKSPGLAKWLQDPHNAGLAKDDLDALGKLEDGVRIFGQREPESSASILNLPAEYGRAVQGGYHGVSNSLVNLGAAYGLMSPEEAADMIVQSSKTQKELAAQAPDYYKEFQRAFEEEGKDVDKAWGRVVGSYQQAKDGKILDALKDFGSGSGKTAWEILDLIGALAKTPNPGRSVGYMIAESSPHSVLPMAMGMGLGKAGAAGGALLGSVIPGAGTAGGATVGGVGGFAGGMFAGTALMSAGSWMTEAMQARGVDTTSYEQVRKFLSDSDAMAEVREEASRKGLTQGTIEAAFSLVGGKFLAGAKSAKAGILKKAVAGAKDVAVETLGEGAGEFAGQAAAHKDISKASVSDAVMESIAGLGQSAGTAATVSSYKSLRANLPKATTQAAETLAGMAKQAADTLRAAQALAQAGEAAKESKLFQRMPEKVGELIRAAGGGESSSVYFNTQEWDAYWESKGLSPLRAAEQILGDKGRAYTHAKETNTEMVMPIDQYVEKVAATEHLEGLLPATIIKQNNEQEGMTLAQAQETLKNLPATLDELSKEASSEPATDGGAVSELDQSAREVYKQSYEKFKKAGYTPEQADYHAILAEQRYRSRGDLMGEAPLALYEKENISIEREGLNAPKIPDYDSIDSVLNRLRDEDVPGEHEGRGPSLLEFIRDQGGVKADGPLAGDITGLEADKSSKSFKKLVTQAGMDLDRAATLAFESGYIAEPDSKLLLDALVGELAGSPVFSEANRDHNITETRATLTSLKSQLDALGIDLKAMDNAQVKQMLTEAQIPQAEREEIFLQKKIGDQAKAALQKIEGTNVLDASALFDGKPKKKKSDLDPRLDPFAERFSEDKKALTAIKKAQDPKQGPYTPSKVIPFGWVPNFAAEPTGVIGPERISEPNPGRGTKAVETDPFKWAELKHGATKQLIQKHAEKKIPLTIHTSSDLVAHQEYVPLLPPGTTINMHMMPDQSEIARTLFPGNPSRRRQLEAVRVLREHGFEVNIVEPTVDQVLEMVGGIDEAAMLLGLSRVEAMTAIHQAVTTPQTIIAAFRSGESKLLTRTELDFLEKRVDEINKELEATTNDSTEFEALEAELTEIIYVLDKSEKMAKRREAGLGVVRDEGVEYFQTGPKTAPVFYHRIQQFIEQKMGNSATVEQVRAIIKDIKEEEREWSGIDEFLKGKEKVSKQELLDFLKLNQLEVREVTRSDGQSAPIPVGTTVYGIFDEEGVQVGLYVDRENARTMLESGETIQEVEWDGETTLEDGAFESPGHGETPDRTKYSNYTLPGGENYREVLFTLPLRGTAEERRARARVDGAQAFQSSHWDEANVFAHVRLNDRTDTEGRKILFVEEIQSDWHQEGRKKGYKTPIKPGDIEFSSLSINDDSIPDLLREGIVEWRTKHGLPSDAPVIAHRYKEAGPGWVYESNPNRSHEEIFSEWKTELLKDSPLHERKVPNAPFKKTWHEFALKRILRMAAEGGYDAVAWTTGEQQAERYDLSKQISNVTLVKSGLSSQYFLNAWDKNDIQVLGQVLSDESQVEEYIGKEAAQKLLQQEWAEGQGAGDKLKRLENADLKVGGEGMKGFYDQMIPSFLNKFGKKYGAKVGETLVFTNPDYTAEHASRVDDTTRELLLEKNEAVNVHSLPITAALADAAMTEGFSLFQKQTGEALGMIRIRKNQKIISLFEGSNLSTLLHELGHAWLDELTQDIQTLKARDPESLTPKQMRFLEMEKILLQEFGIESLDQIETKHHEKWAESFEVYLHNGEAPSSALKEAFQRFRSWLIDVWKRLRNKPNVKVSPELRSVFDRLLATEEQIQEVQAVQNQAPWPGVPENIQLAEAEAKMVAEEQLAAKVMQQERRKKEKAYKERREVVRGEVASQIHQMPVYVALAHLQKGTNPDGSPLPEGLPRIRLSKQDIVKLFGEARLKRLPKPYVYTKEGGVHPEIAAEFFGFNSADEMLSAMENAPKMNQMIESLTDAKMREEFGDLVMDGKLAEEAMKVVHNEKRAQMLRMRLEWLASEKLSAVKGRVRSLFRGLPSTEYLKERAHRAVALKKIREMNAHVYQRAESKSAKEALEAYLRGDFEKAYEAQVKELLNHEMYRASVAAQEEVRKAYEFMRELESPAVQKRLANAGPDYLEQINELLDQYEFRKLSNKALRRRASLAEFVAKLDAQNIPHAIPDEVVADSRIINYRELTLEELRGVVDAAKAIKHLAYTKDKLLLANERAEKSEIAAAVANSILANSKPLRDDVSALVERMANLEKGAASVFLPVETLLELLDGKEFGPLYEHIKRPIDRAYRDVLIPMEEKFGEEASTIYQKFYSAQELRAMNRERQLPGITRPLSKYEILTLAMYQGTESSRQAVLDSEGLFGRGEGKPTPEQIKTALDTLEKKDWDFVQAVWDYNESLFPEISAAHQRRTGLPLEKLPAISVETKHGTYRGGFMSNRYDMDRTGRKADPVEDAYGDLRSGRLGIQQVSGRFMKERVGSGGQALRLDKNVWTEHLSEVAYNLAMADPVNYVYGVLNSHEVKQAFLDTGNRHAWQALKLWLEDMATGELRAHDILSKALRGLRSTFVLRKLGFNLRSGILQLTSMVAAIPTIGKRYVLEGAFAYMTALQGGDKSIANQIYAQSPYMVRRQRLFNKDIAEVRRITKDWGVPDWLKASSFVFVVKLQMISDHIVYLGAYKKALAETGDSKHAAEYAERVVEKTQGSGVFTDRAAIERGTLSPNVKQSEFVKNFTALSGYMISKFGRSYLYTKQTNFKSPIKAISWATDMALVWSMEGLILALLTGGAAALSGDDDEDESLPLLALKISAKEAAGALPLVKEFTGALDGFPGGGVIGSTAADLAKGVHALNRVVNADEDDEISTWSIKQLNNAASIFTGHPSTFINRIIDARARELDGEEVKPQEYLLGRPRL